ncbi:MFS transporter [Kocuria rhizophila]|uniref:Putative MFS transporter n=1 Tax=Kocuria rhizophila (strain ATCC 9341 / DSM 348 / NBRC 103217 / DC2201) TaxID=378753 RepID=B2GIB0_KOCRD|nr:MFS transporter [Kocuria rhizophila]ASE10428.1 MFS transporter [Kocuria rhizophila]BAG29702.1 putative MFS transporter [Kocuria rhizophila DC2201]VEH75022.1 Inner membrane transport protein YeaN [Kocuria rhizophila]
MALAGVVVTAFTLRLAVSGVSPVLGRITEDLHLSPAEAGVLAMMPSLGFALTGILTTLAMRRVGLEALLIISCALAAAGTVARALTTGDVGFVVLTFVTMCGLGMGNVVLPPVIKKYFPHRIAALSALYSMLLGMSTATAPFFAVPLADAAGWRVSVGSWAVFSLAALLPWLVLWVGARRGSRRPPAEQTPDLTVLPDAVVAPATTARVKPWHSRIGWGVVLMFTGTSANTFSMFLWLPRFLTDTGFSEHTAGLMLSYYAILAVPVSFAVPFLVRRFGNTVVLGLSTVALYALGYLAVLLWPHAQWGGFELIWVWITVFALAQASFPLSITLINARTRTTAGAGSLSGFGQGLGYLAGSLGPLAFGLLFGATGSWWPSFGYLWLMLLVLSGGILLTGRHRFMEDDAAR